MTQLFRKMILPSSSCIRFLSQCYSLMALLLLASSSPAQLERTKIAFSSQRDGNADIYVMDADGKNLVNLTNNPTQDGSPAWSPDGRQVAFSAVHFDAWHVPNSDIYVMNSDGKTPVNLTNSPALDFSPAWSPDGRKIAFMSMSNPNNRLRNHDIYVMNSDGTNPVRLTNNPASEVHPSWSPVPSAVESNQNLLPTFWGKIKRLTLPAKSD